MGLQAGGRMQAGRILTPHSGSCEVSEQTPHPNPGTRSWPCCLSKRRSIGLTSSPLTNFNLHKLYPPLFIYYYLFVSSISFFLLGVIKLLGLFCLSFLKYSHSAVFSHLPCISSLFWGSLKIWVKRLKNFPGWVIWKSLRATHPNLLILTPGILEVSVIPPAGMKSISCPCCVRAGFFSPCRKKRFSEYFNIFPYFWRFCHHQQSSACPSLIPVPAASWAGEIINK